MAKKTLASLFNDNAKVEENAITVDSSVYVASLKESKIKPETAAAVMQHNQKFAATSLGLAKDKLVDVMKDGSYDGAQVTFNTNVEGINFNHMVNKDEHSDSGFDIATEIEMDLPGDEIQELYANIHDQLQADAETE